VRRALYAIAVLAAGAPASCRSAPPPPPSVHLYRVVLLPVEGARTALSEQRGENDIPFALAPEELEARIRNAIVESRVFSDVLVAGPADVAMADSTDPIAAAARFARGTSSDLILRISVKSARLTDLGNNGSTFWSTFTWTLFPAPIWCIDDRSYDTSVAVQAEIYDPNDYARPAATVPATSGKQDLDLWDRGVSPWVIVVPPPLLAGSPSTVSETLTERAVKQMLGVLIESLRTHEVPSRFEMAVAQEGATVRVFVASRRKLRWLSFEVGGVPAGTWMESDLASEADSTPENFNYRRAIELRGAAGARVRVIAEDEGGGREVRTIVSQGRP
jgi:hypothetical protein